VRSYGGSTPHPGQRWIARLRYGAFTSVNEATNANEVERRRAARKRYQAHYRALYDELVDILFQLDPISVHAGNTEKFVPKRPRSWRACGKLELRRMSSRSCSRSSDVGMDAAV
jgi:hypothetical protein